MKAARGLLLDPTRWKTFSKFLRGPTRFTGAPFSLSPFLRFKTYVAVVRISSAFTAQTKRGTNGGTLSYTARSSATGHLGHSGVTAATTHMDRLVQECEGRVKEVVICCGGYIAFNRKQSLLKVQSKKIESREHIYLSIGHFLLDNLSRCHTLLSLWSRQDNFEHLQLLVHCMHGP